MQGAPPSGGRGVSPVTGSPKRVVRSSTTRLLGSRGAKPLRLVEIITDGIEDDTEEINGMEPEAPQPVCNSYSNSKIFKDWVGVLYE